MVLEKPLMKFARNKMTYFKSKSKSSFAKKAGIAALVGASLFGAYHIPSIKRAFDTYIAYETSPALYYKINDGDTLYDIFKAENTNKNFSFWVFKKMFYMDHSEEETALGNLANIIAGTTVILPDMNRDGKVGPNRNKK